MEQEQAFQETGFNELKEEKSKKILIVSMVLLLFGGTYYYYSFIKTNGSSNIEIAQNKPVISSQQESLPALKISGSNLASQNKYEQTSPATNIVPRKNRLEQLEEIQKAEKNHEIIKAENPEKIANTKFRPADKSTLLTLAGKSSGKHDPFSYSESKFVPFEADKNGKNSSYPAGKLPPVPMTGSMGNLPSIPGLPGYNPYNTQGLAAPPAPKQEDLITIKGFIGNKVIAQIDGLVDAFNENDKSGNVKIIAVDPSALTAKFEINGKIFTKTMKSLSNEPNGNIELLSRQ